MASQVRMTCTGCGGFAGYGYTQYSVCHNCNVKSDRQHKEIVNAMNDSSHNNDLSDDDIKNVARIFISLAVGAAVAYYCYKHNWLNDSTGRAWTLVWSIVGLVVGYTEFIFHLVIYILSAAVLTGIGWGIYYWITHP